MSLNKFVVIACASLCCHLVAARPDLSLGYRYNQGHSSGGGAFLTAPSDLPKEAIVQTSYAPVASAGSYFNAAPALGQYDNSNFKELVSSNGGSQHFGGSSSLNTQFIPSAPHTATAFTENGASSSNYYEQEAYLSHLQNHQAPIVTKHFYLHSAPEDHAEDQIVRYVNVGRPQKNYRVVFINAPSSTVSKAKVIANIAPTEEKTAIYVLSKKSNELDVSAEVVTQAPVNSKPEVFFIKYKTPQEAIHAQHTIQAQYDSLGGSSDVIDEGILPVSSVIGSLDGAASHSSGASIHSGYGGLSSQQNFGLANNADSSASSTSSGSSINNLSQAYLPPNQK